MIVKHLGHLPYLQAQKAMQEFVDSVTRETESEVWFVEHPKVYTQGINCDLAALNATDIPIVKSDRGGQITYHGPGQVVMYVLLNIKQYGLNVKQLVFLLEQIMINVLLDYGIHANRKEGAPGVYVKGAKIGALGLRFRKGFSYHGLSLNVDMDLKPFENIDPCGYQGLQVTQIKDERILPQDNEIGTAITNISINAVQQGLITHFESQLALEMGKEKAKNVD